jgi:serine/threonine-protein kinase
LEGFCHLEAKNILHRDIRPQNILVRSDGGVKIIDLGFGKKIDHSADFDKSISLNWWCDPPSEFGRAVYDFRTEVYFVGKLFEKIIKEKGIQHFKYRGLLGRMCRWDPSDRVASFFDVQKEIKSDQFHEIAFSEEEEFTYRNFSDQLCVCIAKIGSGTKYIDDPERIRLSLESTYRACMLEEYVPDSAGVLRCFIGGNYRYFLKATFPTSTLRDFIRLLKSCGLEKQRIVIANIHTRLDAVQRYEEPPDDDIPF